MEREEKYGKEALNLHMNADPIFVDFNRCNAVAFVIHMNVTFQNVINFILCRNRVSGIYP